MWEHKDVDWRLDPRESLKTGGVINSGKAGEASASSREGSLRGGGVINSGKAGVSSAIKAKHYVDVDLELEQGEEDAAMARKQDQSGGGGEGKPGKDASGGRDSIKMQKSDRKEGAGKDGEEKRGGGGGGGKRAWDGGFSEGKRERGGKGKGVGRSLHDACAGAVASGALSDHDAQSICDAVGNVSLRRYLTLSSRYPMGIVPKAYTPKSICDDLASIIVGCLIKLV